MCDFSRSNKLPTAKVPRGLDDILKAMGGFSLIAAYVYQPIVTELLGTAR